VYSADSFRSENNIEIGTGSTVQRVWPRDGSERAGKPYGPKLRISTIHYKQDIEGDHYVNMELSDGTRCYHWELWAVEPDPPPASLLWPRVIRDGWTCSHCGWHGRAETDFRLSIGTAGSMVICRKCGWVQDEKK